jgi:hypothetical protein
MKRRLHIPKAAQIRGLRKAIANRKTPRAFIPSMKKRLAKLTGAVILIAALCGCAARPAAAQAPVSIIPSQQVLAPAGTACTGSAQTFQANNRNQTIHYVNIIPSVTASIYVEIDGMDAAGNTYRISDLDAVTPLTGISFNGFSLVGYGYYPTVQVSVTCGTASGTFTLTYSSSSSAFANVVGSYQTAQLAKEIFSGTSVSAGSVLSPNIQTPFGNSLGILSMQGTNVTGTAGVTVTCIGLLLGNTVSQYNFTLTYNGVSQIFPVPASTCPILQVTAAQKAGATIQVEYLFQQPGFLSPSGQGGVNYTHITGTTATVVKTGPGVVHTVVIGTSGAGTISLFDLVPASCTGTPATNTVSVITEFASATPPPPPEIYDAFFSNGICVKASAAMDITISSQ